MSPYSQNLAAQRWNGQHDRPGLTPIGRELRPDFKIVEGRDLNPGVNEIITSKAMADRFENLNLGEQLEINRVNFKVVGYFEANGSSSVSEVWADIRDLTAARRVQGFLSCVNLRATDEAAQASLIDTVNSSKQFRLNAMTEQQYFASLAESGNVFSTLDTSSPHSLHLGPCLQQPIRCLPL